VVESQKIREMKLLLAIYGFVAGMNGRVHEMSVKHQELMPETSSEKVANAEKCPGITDHACSDKITWLPGLDKLPGFDMYSGYLHVSTSILYRYILYSMYILANFN